MLTLKPHISHAARSSLSSEGASGYLEVGIFQTNCVQCFKAVEKTNVICNKVYCKTCRPQGVFCNYLYPWRT